MKNSPLQNPHNSAGGWARNIGEAFVTGEENFVVLFILQTLYVATNNCDEYGLITFIILIPF